MKLPASDDQADSPNLTPVIDVVFLLLIFFLVATRFDQEEREIDLILAKVAQARPVSTGHKPIIVNVDKKGGYKIAGQSYSANEVTAILRMDKSKNPNMQIVQIRCDERAQFRYPVAIVGICEDEEIRHSFTVVQAKK